MPPFHTSLGEGMEAVKRLAGWPLLPLRQTTKVRILYMVGRFVTGRFEAVGSFVVGTLLIRGIYCLESLVDGMTGV